MDFETQVQDLVTQLDSVGCHHPDTSVLNKIIANGKSDPAFASIVSWISHQIAALCNLESLVHEISPDEDDEPFSLEVSSLLRELYCPLLSLTDGPLEERLKPRLNKVLLLEFLLSELQAARVISSRKPPPQSVITPENAESQVAKTLKKMLVSLNFGKPPPSISAIQLFTKVEEKLKNELSKLLNSTITAFKPLFTGFLSERQWYQLSILQQDMHVEYTTRRKMLLTRLDVTIDSFRWAERLKVHDEKIAHTYMTYKKQLAVEPCVDIADLLSADSNTLVMNVTSDALCRVNTRSRVNTVIIGMVPDRGGRPDEQKPPPPEIPSWQKPTTNMGSGNSQRGGFQDNSYRTDRSNRTAGSYNSMPTDGYGDYKSGGDYRGNKIGNYQPTRSHNNIAEQDSRGFEFQMSAPGYLNYGIGDRNKMPNVAPQGMGNYVLHNPQAAYMPGMYQVSDHSQIGFGVGIGGYAATGGNFQQHGTTQYSTNDSSHYNRGGGGRSRNRRGRRP